MPIQANSGYQGRGGTTKTRCPIKGLATACRLHCKPRSVKSFLRFRPCFNDGDTFIWNEDPSNCFWWIIPELDLYSVLIYQHDQLGQVSVGISQVSSLIWGLTFFLKYVYVYMQSCMLYIPQNFRWILFSGNLPMTFFRSLRLSTLSNFLVVIKICWVVFC